MTNNYRQSYEELLDLTNEIYPHQRLLNSRMTEIRKCLNRLSPDIMNDVRSSFETQVKYSILSSF